MYVKVCGVTRESDVEVCVRAGVSAIGLNLVPGSRRQVTPLRARELAAAAAGRIEVVLVVADVAPGELAALRRDVGGDWVQLHGHESPEQLLESGPRALKAVGIETAADAETAARYPGRRLLVDAKSPALGGTGRSFDWALVRGLARERDLVVAGGLTPRNVADAVLAVRPFGVDVASGVESAPGIKDPELVEAFVKNARAAAAR
ncbi:MAG: phosphoribosylanthranilate isomerase [Deltaproteobacteria bacterium]|nr:phosphoribosylanthranilate isomerase [Deltaproteobacteria bacterium]